MTDYPIPKVSRFRGSIGAITDDIWFFQTVAKMYREKAHEILRVTGDRGQFHDRMALARQNMRWLRDRLEH